MNDTRLYFGRRQMHDQFDLFLIKYIDKETGVYHKVTGFDGSAPLLTGYEFKEGQEIEPLVTITGAFFRHLLGREGMEEFIENLCSTFNYVPSACGAKLDALDKMINRVAGAISYCARHKTFPGEDEPCWQCVNHYLDEKREEMLASLGEDEERE